MNKQLSQTEQSLPHGFEIRDRSTVFVTGVIEVLSFDESSIMLNTTAGGMAIEGSALKIGRLSVDNGELSAAGTVDSVYYFKTGKTEHSGLLSRIFK